MRLQKVIQGQRLRRKYRVRKKVRGDGDRPRLTVTRSHKHISVQVVDDEQGRTLCAASTLEAGVKGEVGYGGNRKAAEAVGRLIAERALQAGVKQVCFDRGSYKYHGRIAALADAARQAGLGL